MYRQKMNKYGKWYLSGRNTSGYEFDGYIADKPAFGVGCRSPPLQPEFSQKKFRLEKG